MPADRAVDAPLPATRVRATAVHAAAAGSLGDDLRAGVRAWLLARGVRAAALWLDLRSLRQPPLGPDRVGRHTANLDAGQQRDPATARLDPGLLKPGNVPRTEPHIRPGCAARV